MAFDVKKEFKQLADIYKENEKNLEISIEHIYSNLENYLEFAKKWMDKVVETKNNIFPSHKENEISLNNYVNYTLKKNPESVEYCLVFFLFIREIVQTYLIQKNQLVVNANEEFMNFSSLSNKKKNPKKYFVNLTDTQLEMKVYAIFIFCFYLESFSNKLLRKKKLNNYVCIDLEFNKKELAIMQINYEAKYSANIFLTDPKKFTPLLQKLFNQLILENRFIIKILHGSDSLDIPNIYKLVLLGNRDSIIKFTRSMVDTRFLCEYQKSTIEKIQPKCTIYNALLDYKVVDQDKFQYLEQITEQLGPVQDIAWYLHKISKMQITYAYNDVLFLKYLYQNIFKMTKSAGDKVHEGLTYVPEITQFIYLERRDVTGIINRCKTAVDPINNFFIRKNDGTPITIITIFNKLMENPVLNNNVDIKSILAITLFKTLLLILFKYITFSYISYHYTINKDRKTKYDQKLELNWVLNDLEQNKFDLMKKLILSFRDYVKNKIKLIL